MEHSIFARMIKLINQEVMNKIVPSFQLNGHLYLELDQYPIQVELEGQFVKLTFSSISALKRFIVFKKSIDKSQFPFPLQSLIQQLKLTYYIESFFVGESSIDLKPTWLGRYFGLERSTFHIGQILKYFFRKSAKFVPWK